MKTRRQKKKPTVPDFTFREAGVLYAVACSSLSLEETVCRARANVSGTKAGWLLADDNLPDGVESNPWPCSDHPGTHMHYLFVC